MEIDRLAGTDPARIAEVIRHYEEWERLEIALGNERASGEMKKSLCDVLIQSGAYDEALTICSEAAALLPDDEVAFYNLAGIYALTGKTDEALSALERDVELGDRNFGYLETDPWFESVREQPRYKALIARMRSRAGKK